VAALTGCCLDAGTLIQAVQALLPLAWLNPAQTERMPGRIGIDLEVVDRVDVLRRLEQLRTQRHDTIVGGHEVLDPQVEVDLFGVRQTFWQGFRGEP
jgi:hypothetical protein